MSNPLREFLAGYYEIPPTKYVMEDKELLEFTGHSAAKFDHRITIDGYMPNDLINTYKLNNDGYRSPEFGTTKDVVFAGCSNTFGTGVPEETVWGAVACNSLNLTYENLGMAGVSAHKIVTNLMAHLKQYGKPKYIFCLFPNFGRMSLPIVDQYYRCKDIDAPPSSVDVPTRFRFVTAALKSFRFIPKIIKKPFFVEDTSSIELATMLSIQSIQMLEMYCKEAGIKLLWSTWSDPDDEIYEWLLSQGILENYISVANDHWLYDFDEKTEFYLKEPCHLELRSRYLVSFDIGTDGEHLGVHRHAHIAEAFLAALNSK